MLEGIQSTSGQAILAFVLVCSNDRQGVWHPANSRILWHFIRSHSVWMAGIRWSWCVRWIGVDNVECIISLRLRGWALSVYRRLTCDPREDLEQVKWALLIAFTLVPFVAFDKFISHHLCPEETRDKYLGDL